MGKSTGGMFGIDLHRDIGDIVRISYSDYKTYKKYEPQIKSGVKATRIKLKRVQKKAKQLHIKKKVGMLRKWF